ncbi:hypothetical protein AUJ68_02730 [Candidatus Woesearchaeota archaeon CG1_02_57_44]|nr:MAG: hypothetical protein AUJ68_02730 [Candidatus Woesearchaeota archaeon CG1_02_57_44]
MANLRVSAPPVMFNITNTLFSLVVIYFIYLFSQQQVGPGWHLLGIAALVYLILVLAGFFLFILLFTVSSLASMGLWLAWMGRRR